MRKSDDLFEMAAEIERRGVEFYTKLARRVGDERGSALFKYLASQEKEHEKLFMEAKSQYSGVKFTGALPVLTADEIFSAVKLDEMDDVEAMEYAIGVERRTAELYRRAASSSGDEGLKKFLETLATVEEGHEKVLIENLEALKSEGAWQGYVPILEG